MKKLVFMITVLIIPNYENFCHKYTWLQSQPIREPADTPTAREQLAIAGTPGSGTRYRRY